MTRKSPLVLIAALSLIVPLQAIPAAAGPAAKPHAAAAGQGTQAESIAIDGHESGGSRQPHSQRSSRRPSSEKVETSPHDSRNVVEPPPDVFESPEAKAAKHIPEPLPSDEVRVKRPSLKAASRKSDLELAWQAYNRGDYAAAAERFAAVIVKDPRNAENARLGLAYTRLKQERRSAAIEQLERLAGKGYRLNETLPLLLGLLQEEGDFEAIARHLYLLPPKDREHWTRKALEGRAVADFDRLKQKKAPADLQWAGFAEKHRPALDRCIRPDLFYEAAAQLQADGDDALAVDIFSTLRRCELPPDLRLGVVSRLSLMSTPDAAIDLLRRERPWFRLTAPRHLAEIDRLEILALKRKLDSLPAQAAAERRSTAEAILSLAPGDLDALTVLAWNDFEQRNYRRSASLFEQLLVQNPRHRDYALGLGYSRFNLGELETALAPLDRTGVPDNEETLRLRSLVYKARAQRAYDNGEWQAASENLEAALEIDPRDTGAGELLAWTRFQQQRTGEALALMETAAEQTQDPRVSGNLLDMYSAADEPARGWRLARRMAAEEDRESRRKAADFFFSQGAAVSAAQTDPESRRCYTGAASPGIESFVAYKHKTGDDGTSKLDEASLPVTLVYPTAPGNTWSLSLTPRYLSSGDAPADPSAGRYYRFLDGEPQTNDLEDDLLVWQPDVGLEHEGPVDISAHLGTSPIGGAVDPTPTLALRVAAGRWHADLHRCTVKDSILSYSGLEDPYSSRKWGRVTRNGVSVGATWSLFENYWLSASTGYNHYSGERLWNNDSYHFDTAAGRTFERNGDELTLGLFLTAQHYRRNSDFYTYGHGGYYSPELMTLVGPFFRYRSARCRTYWFDLQASAGWLHQKLDDSPAYPLFDGDVTGFTPAAAAETRADYKGDTDDKLGLSAKIQGMKLVTDRVAVGGFAGIDNNADYTRWQAGAGVHIFFEPQTLFWQRRDFFTDFGDCSNR